MGTLSRPPCFTHRRQAKDVASDRRKERPGRNCTVVHRITFTRERREITITSRKNGGKITESNHACVSRRACVRTGRVGKAQRATTNVTEATERTRSNTEQASRTNVSGQCEVFAKCKWTTELPQNAETGAPRADANDGEKAGVKLAKMLNYTY